MIATRKFLRFLPFSKFASVVAICATPNVGWADASEDSVVKISCFLAGGQAIATGFAWSAPTRVVTALHAVAGCDRITVWSEKTKRPSAASIISVLTEADLALLELDRDLGLQPLVHAASLPPIDDDYTIWGYPRAVPSMLSGTVRFARGLAEQTTLGEAFFRSPDELSATLQGQSYPTWDTKILRVGSTLQPGQSGAPILDRDGVVVAIANGGLFDGVVGINWSIPATEYLPGLEQSRDVQPDGPSSQNLLFSSIAPREEKSVAFQYGSSDGEERSGELQLTRTIPLSDVMRFTNEDNVEAITETLGRIEELLDEAGIGLSDLFLDVYEEFEGGATIVVPSNAVIAWDEESRLIEAMDPDDVVEFS